MKSQKLILSILGLVIVIGLGFLAIKSNNKIGEEGGGNPAEKNVPPVKNPPNPFAEFGSAITLSLNSKLIFSDGLNVVLKDINDSRCPKDVQCIWAGEISGTFAVSGGKLSASRDIRLGTVNNKSVVLEGYTFSLRDATATSITIVVTKN